MEETSMENKLDLPYPICVFISEAALATIKHSTIEVYSRQGTEWGGLLWGECFAHPAGGVVPVVVFATSGICRATPASCDILPASWDAGERELNAQGLTELRCLGDYH